jgi:hypothetical protein
MREWISPIEEREREKEKNPLLLQLQIHSNLKYELSFGGVAWYYGHI